MKNTTLSLLGIALILGSIYFLIAAANGSDYVTPFIVLAGVIICIVAAVKSAKNDE